MVVWVVTKHLPFWQQSGKKSVYRESEQAQKEGLEKLPGYSEQ